MGGGAGVRQPEGSDWLVCRIWSEYSYNLSAHDKWSVCSDWIVPVRGQNWTAHSIDQGVELASAQRGTSTK